MKNDYIKDTRIRRTYSGRKRKATGYFYITGSPYRDGEGSSQLRFCICCAIINADPIIGGGIDKSELYRQFLPVWVKDTEIIELGNFECVSSVITISPVLNIERNEMGPLGILVRIYYGVYICNCYVCYYVSKQFTQHTFVYDSHFLTKEKSACCGAIIDIGSYAPIYVLEVKDREIKHTLNNMLRNFFEGTFIVKYSFKVTSHDFP